MTTDVMSKTEIQAARRRIAEEAAKADEETRQMRLAQKKVLVGEVETVEAGRGGVKANLKRFLHKGRTWETTDGNDGDVTERSSSPPPPTQTRSAGGPAPWETKQNTAAASAAPKRSPIAIPKTMTNQKEVFENTEKAVPSLFAGRSRGGKADADAAGSGGGTGPTAAERAATDRMRPKNWDGKTYYGLSDLRQRKTPPIDMKLREQYLSPDDFQKAFGMTKGAFCCLPKWKRDRLKQSLHLH